MTMSTREQMIQRNAEWENTHGPWSLYRDGDDYVINPEGSWGEGVYGPMIHNAACRRFNDDTPATLEHITWVRVKKLEMLRRTANEPISFCTCVSRNEEDFETRAARMLAAARQADPGLTERVAARRAARRTERGY